MALDRPVTVDKKGEYFAIRNQVMLTFEAEQTAPNAIRFFADPYSFNAIQLPLSQKGNAGE